MIGFDIDAAQGRAAPPRRELHRATSGRATLRSWLEQGRFDATSDIAALGEADVHPHLRPDAADREPRAGPVSYVEATGRRRSPRRCGPGNSSCWRAPPTPARRARWSCRSSRRAGLKPGDDFFLAFSPEREDPGNRDVHRRQPSPRWWAGSTPDSLQLADRAVLAAIVDSVVPVSSCEVAEACKILENTYRAVNIALVNELKMLFDRMGIDVWEVIDAAKTKPFGFQAFYPGPGLGGHCIPIDPFYLTGWPASTACPRGSSSWPARSTPPCRTTSIDRVGRSAERATASRSAAAGSASWAWRTRRTSTIRAKARPSS